MSTEIRPFEIRVTEAELEDLSRRLHATRLPERETPSDWSQGVPLDYARELLDYWRDDYDWSARQAVI